MFSILAVVGVALTVATTACDEQHDKNNDIALLAPASNAAVDLQQVEKITFSWSLAEGVVEYTLKFSPTQAGLATTAVAIDAGVRTTYDLSKVVADNMLAAYTQAQPGATAEIYWTVVPATSAKNVKTNVRKLTITRLPAEQTDSPTLSVSPTHLEFAHAIEAPKTVSIVSNTMWTITVEPAVAWLTITPTSGSGNATVAFAALANTGSSRTATVTVSATGAATQTIAVEQQ